MDNEVEERRFLTQRLLGILFGVLILLIGIILSVK
jgi:hypothetical protein